MPDNILFPELQPNLSQYHTPEYDPSFDYFKNLTNDTYRRSALEYNKGNKGYLQSNSPFAGLDKISDSSGYTYSFPEYFSPKNEDYDAIRNSKYFPEFGFVKGSENDSTYRNLQTFGDRFENAIIGGGKIAAFQFVDQLKGWGRIVDAAASWDWSKLYDQNDMEEVNKNLERIMNENRIFTDKRDDDSIFTWANAFNTVQQSGFTIGAIAEIAAEELLTAGMASAFEGVKVGSLLRTLGSWGKAAEKLQDATTSVSGLRKIYETGKFLPMGETISGIAAGLAKEGKDFKSVFTSGFGGFYRDIREMNAAFTEARAEASGTYAELKDKLLNDGASAQDADRIAREAAGTNFNINAAVIGLSNKIQFDNIFRGIKGAKSIIEEGSPLGMWKGQFFKRGFNLNTLKEGLRNRPIQYFKNNLTEALQENIQDVSNNAVQKYYETRYKNPGKESIVESLSEGIESQYSKQGMKTFLSGFLTGAITSPLTSGISKLYRRVSTTSEQRQKQKADINEKVASLNGLFSSQHAPNSGLQLSIGDAMADAIKMGDTKGFQDLKDQSVREFVRTSIETGQFDAVFARLDNYIGKLSKTEFEKAFGIPFSDKSSAVDYVNSLREKANAIKETHENFEFKFGANPFSPVNSKVQYDAYNNAKWQYLFMKDAHKRAGERANSILSDLSNSVRSIPSTEFTILFDKNLLKSEQKALKDEIALEIDPKIKKLKQNKLASLEVISNNDEFNPTYYEKHIKNVIKSYRSSETDEVIQEAVAKLKDIIDLKDNEKDLLKNINWLIQPANYARYFETHVDETQKVYEEATTNPPVAIEDKPAPTPTETKEGEAPTPPLSDFRKKLDLYAKRFNEEGQANHRKIKQELFGDVEDIVDNLEDSKYLGERMSYWRAVVLSRNNLQNLLDKIEDRTYDDLSGVEKFTIRQAKDFLEDPIVTDLYKKVQDLLSFNEKMGEVSEKPKPVKGTVKKGGIFTPQDEIALESGEDEEPEKEEEKVVVSEAPYEPQDLETTQDEVVKGQDKSSPIADLEDYGYFKGHFLRQIQSESLLGNYDFVVMKDSDELTKHHNSPEFKGKKFEGDNPFTYTGERYGYVIVVKSKQGDILYFDKNYRKVSKEEGVPLIYAFSKTADRKLIENSLDSKGEAILDVHKVSPGGLEQVKEDIFPVSEFIKGTHLEDKAKEGNLIFIATTEDTVHKKGKYYLSLGKGMNDIQVITRWMSQLQLNGEKINPMDLLSLTYDNEDVPTQVAEYLNGVIYTNKKKGNFFEVARKDDKFIIEARGLSLDQYAKNNLNLERKHLDFNYKGYQGEKIIYYVKDGKLQSKKVIYIDFALENTLTNRRKLRTKDGKFVIEPVNNKLIFSLPRPSVKPIQTKTSTVSEGVEGDKIKLDPDLANIDPTIQAARNGDNQAQKKLEKYGIDWEQTTTYRFVGQSEVDVLLSDNKVESKRFTDAGIDVTTSDKVTSAANNEYRVTFKESFDVNNGLGKVKIKSKEEGDHNLERGRGYDINDVAKIERIDERGNVVETIYEQSQANAASEAGSIGVGGDVMKGVNDKMRQTKLEMEFKDGDALSFKNEDTEIVIAKPIGADGKYSVTISEKSDSNTGLTINEGKTKLFDTKLEALDYAKELKEQSLKEQPKAKTGSVEGDIEAKKENNKFKDWYGRLNDIRNGSRDEKAAISAKKLAEEIFEDKDFVQSLPADKRTVNGIYSLMSGRGELIDNLKSRADSESKKDEFVDTSGKIDREAEIAKALKRLEESKDKDTDITNLQNKQGLFRLIDSVFDVEKISSDEINWLKSTFDDYPVVIRIVNDIINGNAWGQFTQDATYIYKGAKKGTAYHEAWHNFTQLFLTKDEKLKLYNDNKLEDESDLAVEERLADSFMQFAQSNGTVLPESVKSRNIFQKIWDFIKALFGEKTISADKLFNDLYKGNLNAYDYSKSNSLFSTLNAAILDNQKKEILSVEQAKQYFDHFDSLLGQYLADKSLFFNFLLNVKGEDRIKLLTGIYTNILSSLNKTISDIIQSGNFNAETDQTLATINKIFDNKEIVLQSWTQRLFKAPTQKEIEKMELQERPSEPEAEEEGELQVSDLDPNDEEQILNKTGEFTQQSIATTLTKETKALIRLLSKVQVNPETGLAKRNSEGKIVLYKNEAGLTEPVNPSIFIDTLGEMLADTYTYDVMYETIRNTNNIKKLPELELLLERLPNPADNGDFSRQLRSSFERDFNRSYVGVFDASLQRDSDGALRLFFQEETKRGLNYIKKKFSENFQKLQPSKYIQKTDDGKNSLTKAFAELLTYYNSKDDTITKKLASLNQILELMGFKFTKNAANSPELKEFISNQDKALDLAQFFGEIAKRINDGATIKNPVSDFFQKREDGYSLARLLYELFSIEEKYSTDISSLTYQTAKGTQKYALMNPAFLFIVMNKIKAANNLTDLAQDEMSYLDRSKNPNINNSLVINSLFDKTGKRRTDIRKKRNELIFGDYNGLKHNIDGKDQRKQTTDLTLREKVIMDINSLLTPKMGYVDIMRTESSASSYFYKLNDYLHNYAGLSIKHSKDIPFSLELLFQDEREGRKYLYSYFAGIWQDEQDMMKKQGISSSGIFRDILAPNKQYTRDEFNKALDEFFMKETNAFMGFMSSKGIASDTGIINSRLREELEALKINPENYLSSLARAYVINTFVLNVEYSKIVSGPIQYYKAYHKRAKTAISTGIPQSTSDYVRKRLEESFERTMGNILNPKKNFVAKTYKVLTTKDDVRKIAKSTVKLWKAALGDKFNPKKIDKYDDINVADGQGRISFDGYREFRIRTGTWNNEEEATYLREVIAWKRYKGLEVTEKDNQLLEAYKDYKDVPFKPIKAQYDGHMAKEGHYPVAHKFSLAPLIPSVVAGTPLEDIHEYLLENNIAYMLHESGSKKYQGGIADLFKRDEKGISDLYSNFLKEQIVTKSKRRDESTWGTQMRKLFLANLFEKGKAGGEVESLYKEYIQNMNNIMQEEKDALYREFGIKEEGGKIVISDVKPFIDSLLGQMEARNLNQNLKNSIKYDDITGNFKYPLEINLNRQDIINLIGGMIDRRLRRLKVNGDILTLISSSGMLQKGEELRGYEPVFDKNGKFTHVRPMQVKIGWSSHYTPLLGLRYKGETISNVDNLNKALRDDNWVEENMESLLHIGYRIPTQGPNSMEFFVPAEFLSEAFYGIIPPPEYVVKTGGDFDDDKLHIFRPTLDVNGNIANDNYINTLRKRKAKILEDVTVDKIASKISSQILSGMEEEEDFDDMVESLPKEVKERMKELKSINSEIKGFYHNKSLAIYHKILSSPEMFEQLITPNSASEVKDMAVEIGELLNLPGVAEVKKKEDFKATQVFLGRNNYTKFLQNLSGKAHLGMWAVNNTFSQLLQQAGVTINKGYVAVKNIKGVDTKFKRTYNQHLMTQEEKKEYGASLSNLYFPDGKKLRQEIISELINATVDIASDPFYSFLGINEHNKGVVAYLLQQGTPFRRIILFINQSPLRTYYNMREREPFRDIEGTAYPTTNMLMMDLMGIEIQKNMRIVYENTVERIDNSHTGFTEQELYDNVKGTDDDVYSKKILAHFVKLREQAEIFRKVQMSNSYDTTKYSTSLSALQNENMKREVEQSGLFNNVQNIQNQSLVSSFDNRNIIRGVFSSLFPFGYNETMVKTFDSLSPKLFNKKDKERFERRVAADFIEYIVKNYGYSPNKDKNFAQYAIELITDANPLYKRILDIKTKYPELEERFEIISKIFPNFEAGKPFRKNLEIIRNIDNNTDYQELLIDDYKKMLKFSPSMINKTSMPNEDVAEIRKIMYDLAYIGFMQSGFNKSLFFFSDVIPTEIFNNNFTEALEKYMRLSQDEKVQFIKSFRNEFVDQNPETYGKPSKQSYRGKAYGLNKVKVTSEKIVENELAPAPVAAKVVKTEVKDDSDFIKDDKLRNLVNFLNNKGPFYFYDVPSNLKKDEVINIIESDELSKKFRRVITPDNIEKAKKLDKKYDEIIHDKTETPIDIDKEYKDWELYNDDITPEDGTEGICN